MTYIKVQTGGHVCTKFIMLFSLTLAETQSILKVSFATIPHAFGPHMGPDTFRFVVDLLTKAMKYIFKIGYWLYKIIFSLVVYTVFLIRLHPGISGR